MSTANSIPIARNEAFFHLCNTSQKPKAPYLRSKLRIGTALGLLGVSVVKVEQILGLLENLRARDGIASLQTRAGRRFSFNSAATIKLRFREVFAMHTNGPEEEKFLSETVIPRMIWCVVEMSRKRARTRARRASRALAADQDEEMVDAEDAKDLEKDEGTDEETEVDEEEPTVDHASTLSDEDTMSVTPAAEETETLMSDMDTPSPSASRSLSPKTTTLTRPKTIKTPAGTLLPDTRIEIWSTQHARPLRHLPLKEALTEFGLMPSYEKLNTTIQALLPATANIPYILPNCLQFVHVLHDGTNTGIISQELLEMEWSEWRPNKRRGNVFYLWVRDCLTGQLSEKAQPEIKYGAWGWVYHPVNNGPPRFVKLPLR